MQNDILAEVAFASQYAKEKNGKRETWVDAVDRVIDMHKSHFEYHYPRIEKEIEEVFELVKQKRVFCSQRAMQFGGAPILKNNMRIYNCTFSYIDRPRFFSECFFLLLSGSGTGFSIRRKHVNQIDALIPPNKWKTRQERIHYISDTIEGWSNAVLSLIESYVFSCYYDTWHDKEPIFDYSKVRPKGAPISSGGKSPGPEVLETALEKIRNRLREVTQRANRKLTPLDCFDITMYLSEAVLSGGVRRSASIALFDKDDEEMIKCKHGSSWFVDNLQRGYANISAAIKLDGTETEEEVNQILQYARSYGEPGVAFFESDEFGTNPCAEIGLLPVVVKDYLGEIVEEVSLEMLERKSEYEKHGFTFHTGWQACNLTEINMLKNDTPEKFFEACKAASIIGTMQAHYNNVAYLQPTSHYILANESLIGVSLTGMCSNPLSFDPETLREGARIVNEENQKFAKKLLLKSASRTTCIKPSGNTSTIAGCSSGIHPYHAPRYIRRIRMNKENVIWQELLKKVPDACEDDVFNESTGVVAFACKAPFGSLTKDQDNAINHLKRVKVVYDNWIKPGSQQSRVEGLTHNVSNTCTVKENEWDDVSKFIFYNRYSLRGVAVLADTGDKDYKQAPFEAVIEGTESEELYNRLIELDYSIVDLTITGEGENPTLSPACSSGTCDI